jgi:hypothetical protein
MIASLTHTSELSGAVSWMAARAHDIDEFGLPERVKAEIEEFGRVTLSDDDRSFLARSKLVFLFTLVVGCPYFLSTGCTSGGIAGTTMAMFLTNGLEQTVCRQGSAKQRALRAAVCFVKFLFGFGCFVVFLNVGTIRTTQRIHLKSEM